MSTQELTPARPWYAEEEEENPDEQVETSGEESKGGRPGDVDPSKKIGG